MDLTSCPLSINFCGALFHAVRRWTSGPSHLKANGC